MMDEQQDGSSSLHHWFCGSQTTDKIKLDIGELYRFGLNLDDSDSCRKMCGGTIDEESSVPYIGKGPYPLYPYGRHNNNNNNNYNNNNSNGGNDREDDLTSSSSSSSSSGCWCLEAKFKVITEIVEIRFKNYYTASVQVLAKSIKYDDDENTPSWRSVCQRTLMPYPHFETGGQSEFVLRAAAVEKDRWTNISEMRIIMRQPSPVWRTFAVHDARFYHGKRKTIAPPSSTTHYNYLRGRTNNSNNNSDASLYLKSLLERTNASLNTATTAAARSPIPKTEDAHKSRIIFPVGTTVGYEMDKLPKL